MNSPLQGIHSKIEAKERICDEELVWLHDFASNNELMELAQNVKARFHKIDHASYLIMGIINFTNVCVAKCDYCAFYRLPHQEGTYRLSLEQVCDRLDALIALGGTMAAFNNGFHPKLKMDFYCDFFHQIHSRYPHMSFFNMTVAEFMFCCKLTKLTYREGADLLKQAGVEWITGGGAEVLSEGFRKRHSPGKYTVQDYMRAQEAILEEGLGSTATMIIGFDETLSERMDHLNTLRIFQDRNNHPLTSFLCWTYKPYNTAFGGKEISSNEYLRWLALCRIYLDNFTHIRTSVLTKNTDALLGILYGANDFDLPTEDEVTQKAGAEIELDFEKILGKAKDLGIQTLHRPPFQPPSRLEYRNDTEVSAQRPVPFHDDLRSESPCA